MVLGLVGCANIQQQAAETRARGKIDAGGYAWSIHLDSEGGNSVTTHGLPNRQAATDASNVLCRKYGRTAQFIRHSGSLILGVQSFDFNCVPSMYAPAPRATGSPPAAAYVPPPSAAPAEEIKKEAPKKAAAKPAAKPTAIKPAQPSANGDDEVPKKAPAPAPAASKAKPAPSKPPEDI